MEDRGQGLVKRVETAQVPALETKEQGARPLPDSWDRVVGRSVVSVTRRVQAGIHKKKGRIEDGGAGRPLVGRELLAKL